MPSGLCVRDMLYVLYILTVLSIMMLFIGHIVQEKRLQRPYDVHGLLCRATA